MTGVAGEDALEAHRAFLNRYYQWVRPVYDLTRKYWLLGRDGLLDQLADERWTTLVEVGPGTGRNLGRLAARRPDARLGGIEPCDAMLDHARARLPQARLVHGFAETADFGGVLGGPVDRVLFSYSLSMIGDQGAALDRARAALAPGGEIVVVDFADLGGLPGPIGAALRAFLRRYHVTPLDAGPLVARGAELTYGPGRYYVHARLAA